MKQTGAGLRLYFSSSNPMMNSHDISTKQFATDNNAPQLLAPGGMSSNVMIMSPDGFDLGPTKTDELLRAWLSSQAWQEGPRLRKVESTVDPDVLSIH
jgi:hypothetical protein